MGGSARVLTSPNSSGLFSATLRRILLIIFPDLVLGRPGVICRDEQLNCDVNNRSSTTLIEHTQDETLIEQSLRDQLTTTFSNRDVGKVK